MNDEWAECIMLAILAVVILLGTVTFVFYPGFTKSPPHEKYERVYSECVTAETLTQVQCNDIALATLGE